jgi:DNA ligase-1
MNINDNEMEHLIIEDQERDLSSDLRGGGAPPKGGLKHFAELVKVLGTSTKTTDKLEALVNYFASADDKDKVWVIALFSGRKPKRAVNTTQLITWCVEAADLPGWLFGESYHTVGDLAETISLLLPEAATGDIAEDKPLHF